MFRPRVDADCHSRRTVVVCCNLANRLDFTVTFRPRVDADCHSRRTVVVCCNLANRLDFTVTFRPRVDADCHSRRTVVGCCNLANRLAKMNVLSLIALPISTSYTTIYRGHGAKMRQ